MENGMISIDRWRQGSQAYFLTHLHADHTLGLTPTWKWGPLFCSRVTAKLFPSKFPKFNLSLLRILDPGRWCSIPLFSPSSGDPVTIHVMAVDANHCPGAVMYLFRGDFGCMLCTGDFRWEAANPRTQAAKGMLLDALKDRKLDTLYMDNTYCNPSYSFPSRELAARQVVNIIKSHPNHDVVIGIDSLGKEDLLLYVSEMLETKIWVWPERLQTMHLLGYEDIYTTKTSLSRIRAIPRYSFSRETLQALNMIRPTIGIMPSGLPWVKKIFTGNGHVLGPSPADSVACPMTRKGKGLQAAAEIYNQHIYTVPYSDHSCFSEIKEFVELLQPADVRGIVSSSPSYVEPRYYFGKFCGTKQELGCSYQRLPSKRIEALHIKSPNRTAGSPLVGKKRTVKRCGLLSRADRVHLLRRLRCGIKIMDSGFSA